MFAQAFGVLDDLCTPRAICLCDSLQNTGESRPVISIFRRKVSASENRLPVRQQENSQRPPAAAGHDLHGGHVDLIEVRTLFAIDLDIDKIFIHELCDRRVFEGLVLHHMTPVTSRVADAQED